MKNFSRGILLFCILFATSAVYGGQPPKSKGPTGVAGVDVTIKQNPTKRAVTDARGSFAFDALPAGSYTLLFRPQKAKETKTSTVAVTVATSYSIKIEGTKRAINQAGLTGDRLLKGVEIPIEVGGGAKVRGQVLAGGLKKMVWIAAEIGSHMPGHWVEEDSKEASALNRLRVSGEDMREMMKQGDPHQEGFAPQPGQTRR